MNERTRAAISSSGDLGKKVEAHLLATVALVDELNTELRRAEAAQDEALEDQMQEEYKLAEARALDLYRLIRAIQTSGH